MRRTFIIVLLVGGIVSTARAQPASRTATLAKQLSVVLSGHHLDAIAAQDPEEPDRFVAALFYPNVQLLVVSARYAAPQLLEAKLSQKQYRDVYLDLSAAAVPNTTVLIQDMNADGLCSGRNQTADVVRNRDQPPAIFDADWKKQNLSEEEYAQRLSAADELYSHLLEILLAQQQGT